MAGKQTILNLEEGVKKVLECAESEETDIVILPPEQDQGQEKSLQKSDHYKIKFGVFSKDLSIDEQMVLYFGRHSSKMFIRRKPIRFGYKIWGLASSYSYLINLKLTKRSSGTINVKRKKLIALNLFVFTNITKEWEALTFWTDLLVSVTASTI